MVKFINSLYNRNIFYMYNILIYGQLAGMVFFALKIFSVLKWNWLFVMLPFIVVVTDLLWVGVLYVLNEYALSKAVDKNDNLMYNQEQ